MNNEVFLKTDLEFTENSLFFTQNDTINIVMDMCEDSLMKRTSEVLVEEGDDLLEVGFGMGMFANYAQLRNPKSHTIVEGHPQVFEKLKQWSLDKKNVEIIFGDWSKNLEKIKTKKYDSVYFDTHLDQNTYKFFYHIKDSIKIGGKYSRFGLDVKNKIYSETEFGDTKVEILTDEIHNIIPSENVNYFPDKIFPICVVRV